MWLASFTSAATILVHGDSLSAGYGIPPQTGWVQLLQDHYGEQHQIVNASVSGETSQGGLQRLPGLLATHQPDIMLLQLGANDGLRGYPLQPLQTNLQQMTRLAQQSGAAVVIIGIRLPPNLGTRYTEPFFNLFATVAAAEGLLYLPFLLAGIATDPSLMQEDGLHPNQSAQPLILQQVLPLIDEQLQRLAD